jgi:hypothetical protein
MAYMVDMTVTRDEKIFLKAPCLHPQGPTHRSWSDMFRWPQLHIKLDTVGQFVPARVVGLAVTELFSHGPTSILISVM